MPDSPGDFLIILACVALLVITFQLDQRRERRRRNQARHITRRRDVR